MFQLWIRTHWGTWHAADTHETLEALEGVWKGLREMHNLSEYLIIPL